MSVLCLVKSGIVRWLVTRLGLKTGGVEGEALLHMEELGNYTLKYLARRRTRKPPHDLVTGQTPDYMLSN